MNTDPNTGLPATEDPAELLAAFTVGNLERKQRRDRIIEHLAVLDQTTVGLKELVTARVSLLAHQAEVIFRVLADPVCRFMLADEVGLGKTVEAGLILSTLRHQEPALTALILTPAALQRQWCNELHYKFNLSAQVATGRGPVPDWRTTGVLLVAYEELGSAPDLATYLRTQDWSLLVADEAHNLHRHLALYSRVLTLSRQAARTLILTATPVQRRAKEYLHLLRLMHPGHYEAMTEPQFERMLHAQEAIRSTISYLARGMDPAEFDPDEFVREMEGVVDLLGDPHLAALVACVQPPPLPRGQSHAAAATVLRYVSENYRLESRVIRNRRANLQDVTLPQRTLDASYMYQPQEKEGAVLAELHDYADALLRHEQAGWATRHWCKLLFHAAASSPAALLELLEVRTQQLQNRSTRNEPTDDAIRQAARLAAGMPHTADEAARLNRLVLYTRRWQEETATLLRRAGTKMAAYNQPHRLAQVIRAILRLVRVSQAKILVFSRFQSTLDLLHSQLLPMLGPDAVAEFSRKLRPDLLQSEAEWFQKSPRCHVLLTDESGGEGRNFQMADAIIHVDLPWTPTQIEQRIGRVDRLGRSGDIISVVPAALGTIEHDLFRLWHEGYNIFDRSISGLEIALEEVQDHVIDAFARSTRNGLAETLPWLVREARKLRETVEEERYFEEGAINWRQRNQFDAISRRYGAGDWLQENIIATLNGSENLAGYCNPTSKITVLYRPGQDPKLLVQQAQQRQPTPTPRTRQGSYVGTFDRTVAIQREDLAFFTPNHPAVKNLLRQIRNQSSGRTCVARAQASGLVEPWQGFEFLFRVKVNAQPLRDAGLSETWLSLVQGYLPEATMRAVVNLYGEVEPASSPAARWLARQADAETGAGTIAGTISETIPETMTTAQPPKLADSDAAVALRRAYSPGEWRTIVTQARAAAKRALQVRLEASCSQRVQDARAELDQSLAGQWAAYRWLYPQGDAGREQELHKLKAAHQALLQGLERPTLRLESVCFWALSPL